METFTEIVNQVSDLIGKDDAPYLSKIKDWVNRRYDEILRKSGWKDLVRGWEVNSIANQDYIVLPQDVRILTNIHDRASGIALSPITPPVGGRVFPDVLGVPGATPESYWLEETSVLLQPSASGTITAESSDAADTSQVVRMKGRTASGENQATATLNGTSQVNLLADCIQVDQISKSAATTGFITFKDGAGNTLGIIYPGERTARYKRAHLVTPPSGVTTYNIYGKRRAPRLIYDEDVPVIDCWSALVSGAYVTALKQQRRFAQAAEEKKEYTSLLEDIILEQELWQENDPGGLPEVNKLSIDT